MFLHVEFMEIDIYIEIYLYIYIYMTYDLTYVGTFTCSITTIPNYPHFIEEERGLRNFEILNFNSCLTLELSIYWENISLSFSRYTRSVSNYKF